MVLHGIFYWGGRHEIKYELSMKIPQIDKTKKRIMEGIDSSNSHSWENTYIPEMYRYDVKKKNMDIILE